MRGKIGERMCDKKMKKDRMTKEDRAIRETEWHKDKVTEKQNEERQSHKRDRVTGKTECIKNTI